jgi:ATP-dependent Lhr-like helicase
MHEGHIESTRFPRNPLDVLAQQLVAIVAHPPNAPAPARKARSSKVRDARKTLRLGAGEKHGYPRSRL